MNTSTVDLAFRTDGVVVLTIDQPDAKVNVLTQQLWTELEAAIDSLMPRTDLKGLVIASGKPGVFIAGADLKLLRDTPSPHDPAVRAFIEQGLRVLQKLESLPFPTCGAIDGAALGGGLEVALACDCRILSNNPKVQLGLPEVKLGLIPGWGGTQRLPRIVGLELAARMVTTGEAIPTSEAILGGLAHPSSGDLLDSACDLVLRCNRKLARRLKCNPVPAEALSAFAPLIMPEPIAVREALSAMVRGVELPLYQGISLETDSFLNLAGSPEAKRLIGEFFASRKK